MAHELHPSLFDPAAGGQIPLRIFRPAELAVYPGGRILGFRQRALEA